MSAMHPRAKDLRTKRFGRLVVIAESGRAKDRKILWECTCDCGKSTIVRSNKLLGGRTRSCGCLVVDVNRTAHFVHGHKIAQTRTYRSWRAMLARCRRPQAHNFKWYGGQGVIVCDQWQEFVAFLSDMGERPLGTSIDRIDPCGNYEPSNCRWATPLQQANNKRKSNG